MSQTGSIGVGEDRPLPTLRAPYILGHAVPGKRIGKRRFGLGAGRQQIRASIAINVALNQPVDSVNLIVDQSLDPAARLGVIIGLFQPNDQSGVVACTDVVKIAVTVDIKALAMNVSLAVGVFIQHDFRPVWGDKQPCHVAAVSDDVRKSIACEITRHGRHRLKSFVNDVFTPLLSATKGAAGQHDADRDQYSQS